MKQIPNYPDYSVDETGNVFNTLGWKLRPYRTAVGYVRISLKNATGKRAGVDIHRLVAATFLGPIPKGMWVNHKNGNKADNRVENLELTTPSENHCHARDVLKRRYVRGADAGMSKLTHEGIEAVRVLSSHGWSQGKIAKAMLVSQPCISNVLSRSKP